MSNTKYSGTPSQVKPNQTEESMNKSICYIARDHESYKALAEYVATLPVDSHLYPSKREIVVSDNAEDEVKEFVSIKNLQFGFIRASVSSDMSSKEVLLRDALERTTSQRDRYNKWWLEADRKIDRMKKQIDAVAVMLAAIEPRERKS